MRLAVVDARSFHTPCVVDGRFHNFWVVEFGRFYNRAAGYRLKRRTYFVAYITAKTQDRCVGAVKEAN